ncbi:MAG: hypothetical protein JKY88_17385 [Pseudomonadales bacterium]|nr:hypothetical protein [Pseudomonadales bacterium]
MKSFVKALWSRTKAKSENRTLSHPRDLMTGDLIQLSDSFGLPPRLRDQMFKVLGVVTYQFEHDYSSSFSLEGRNNDHIDLTIEEEGGRAIAAFSLAIDPSIVEQLFDMDEFAQIFDPDENAQIKPIASLEFGPWLEEAYVQESCAESAYFYAKDCRSEGPSKYEGDGEAFEYYSLRSGDGDHGIEIEVYASGETDVSLTLYRPVDDIKELWPAKKE